MATHPKRWALLLFALASLAVSLVACQTPIGGGSPAVGNAGPIIISTPLGGSSSPTPEALPFTIGIWPSNTTPDASDTITLYVICQIQDPTMTTPSKPAVGVRVVVNVRDPINQSYTKTTDRKGVAAVKVSFKDSHPGSPVTVDVSATWKGKNYSRQISFTPSPQAQPSPSPHGTPGEGPPGTPVILPTPPATP